jgi:hypothetical protein
MALPVNFDPAAAVRIYNAVRKVEAGDRDQKPLTFRRVVESGRGRTFRMATFTGAWNKGSLKVVTFRNVTSTPNTASALNLFLSVNTATGVTATINCAIAKDGTSWYAIAAECSS